jgi:hypothetical protein
VLLDFSEYKPSSILDGQDLFEELQMKIHEVEQQTGLTVPTLRFYEKEGLLDTWSAPKKSKPLVQEDRNPSVVEWEKKGESRNAKGAQTSGSHVKQGRANETRGAGAPTKYASTTGETRTPSPTCG